MSRLRKRNGTATFPLLNAYTEFLDLFQRSKNHNLWRHWNGLCLTIFKRHMDGFYGWSIKGSSTRYSRIGYKTESLALKALWEEVRLMGERHSSADAAGGTGDR